MAVLLTLPGFMLEYIQGDLMHASDLGLLPIMLGSVIWEVFIHHCHGTLKRPNEPLAYIMTLIKQASKALHRKSPPMNKITLKMVRVSSKAVILLKSKAAEARGMITCMHFVLEHFIPRATDRDEQRFQCIRNMALMYKELYEWKSGSGMRAAEYGRRSLVLFLELRNNPMPRCSRCWHLVPKFHMCVHILEDQMAVSGNPTESWNYADESEIGAARRVAESSHPSTLHKLIISKHRIGDT